MLALLVVITLILLAIPSGAAWAHEGEPLAPHDLWGTWNWNPAILLGILLVGWFYGRGVLALWEKAGTGRGTARWQAIAFAFGLLTLVIALVSPLDALSSELFSAHMLQHLLLMLVAAPLLVLGAPPAARAWAVPGSWRVGLGRWWHNQALLRTGWLALCHPLMVWILHSAALLVWHLPGFYQAALQSEFLHLLEHASFLGTALLFWWVLVKINAHSRFSFGIGILYVFSMAMFSGLLGALITFSRQAWYPIYAASTATWGLTPLEDQQLAGVLMWVPANFIYLIATLLLLKAWLTAMEKRDVYE